MNNFFMLLSYGLGFFLLSVMIIGLYRRAAPLLGVVAVANSRSAHTGIIPSGAGLVLVLLWLVALCVACLQKIIPWVTVATIAPFILLISILGFCDDRYELSAVKRLCAQFILAIIFILMQGGMEAWHIFGGPTALHIGVLGSILGIFGIVWSINLFNFMDGSDGQTSIESFYVLGIGGVFYWQCGAVEMAWIAWAMVSVIAGYLVWNWPRASVFMGDAGSYGLGLLIAILMVIGNTRYQIPMGLWLILYGVFWFDATITLIRRILLKKHWATPHRDHACQRLIRAGYTHQQILWGLMVVNSVLAMLAWWASKHPHHLAVCFWLTVAVLSIIYIRIEQIEPLSKSTS